MACLAAIGVVVFGFATDTAASGIIAAPEPAEPLTGLAVEAPVQPGEMASTEGVFRRSTPVELVDAASRPKRTSGLIRGDVTLTASTIDKITAITIRVVEAVRDDAGTGNGRRPFTYQQTIPFNPKDGTPKFNLDEIPFSDFGYLVQAYVAGLNGTEQIIQLNEQNPIADVVLGIHPGTPFSLLLRDQDLTPLANVEVMLSPDGPPAGRGAYREQTDTFGAAVFHDVLRGTYQAHIGPMSKPLLPPQAIEVLASSGLQAQSKTIIVPKGEALTVNLYAPTGHGIAEVEVKLSSGSDVRYREVKQTTDWSGRTTFAHLAPGSYWVNVIDPRYEPRTIAVVVRAGEKPKDADIRLVLR